MKTETMNVVPPPTILCTCDDPRWDCGEILMDGANISIPVRCTMCKGIICVDQGKKWNWKMDWCKTNGLPPAQNWVWDKAEEAWQSRATLEGDSNG